MITEAYRKFLYLKALSGETLTPPKWVDSAWHLHLSFAQDYALLEAAVGRQIVHSQDLTREEFQESYEHGRSLWGMEFDDEPPEELWPSQKSFRKNAVITLFGFMSWIGLTAAIASFGIAGVSQLLGIASGVGVVAFFVCISFMNKVEPDTISRCG